VLQPSPDDIPIPVVTVCPTETTGGSTGTTGGTGASGGTAGVSGGSENGSGPICNCDQSNPNVQPPSMAATPELDSLALMGSGLFGFAGYGLTRWRSRRRPPAA